jgi:hypothetical protein
MRISTRLGVLACCCAALAACTAVAPRGPSGNVTTPSVGKPPPPASGQAALSSEAFTPYAALGISSNDGLAPGESQYALIGPCMSAAGYSGVTVNDGIVPFGISIGGSLAFTQPWGGWGYLGTAEAQQYGFRVPPGTALTTLGLGGSFANPPSVPAVEQAAASKCATIIQAFASATQSGPLAGIITLGNDIQNDMQDNPSVTAATSIWSACMARNGYSFSQAQNVFMKEIQAMMGNARFISPSTKVSAAANQAQIAVAVTDADCTQSSDLAGIYFAVQADYEQQLVTANQQALDTAVSQYRAAYATELNKLPALLGTTKAEPFHPARAAARTASHTR